MEDGGDVSSILTEEAKFFNNFFSNLVRWNNELVVCETGAWVRIYGVPLHVWNLYFLKLCVYGCGRLLMVDDFTMDKLRFHYPRVLISTSSMEILITSANVLVDWERFAFKIIEEWGFALCDDACLGAEEESQVDDEVQPDGAHDDVATSGDVDVLLNQLSEEWQKEDFVVPTRNSVRLQSVEKVSTPAVEKTTFSLVAHDCPLVTNEIQGDVTATVHPVLTKPSAELAANRDVSKPCLFSSGDKRPVKRTRSCPPGRVHSITDGP